jgi:hypothetical protein
MDRVVTQATGTARTVGEAVLEAVRGAPGCVLVAAPDDPAAQPTRDAAPERFVPVASPGVRAAVAAGIALASRPVCFLTEGEVPAALPRPPGFVAVVARAAVAGACWGSGWTLAQPASGGDLVALLGGALAAPVPVVVRLPGDVPAGSVPPGRDGEGAPLVTLGAPRVVRDGAAGLLVGSGAARAGLLVAVARMLAGRGVALQAVEMHTAAGGEGPGPQASDTALFLGHRSVDVGSLGWGRWPQGLLEVAVPDDARGAMEAVAARLRARR